MTLTNPQKDASLLADGNDKPMITAQQTTIAEIADTTGGTAGDTVNDTTAGVKDDIASLAAKINGILQVLASHGLISDA